LPSKPNPSRSYSTCFATWRSTFRIAQGAKIPSVSTDRIPFPMYIRTNSGDDPVYRKATPFNRVWARNFRKTGT